MVPQQSQMRCRISNSPLGALLCWLVVGGSLLGCGRGLSVAPPSRPLLANASDSQLVAQVGEKTLYVRDIKRSLHALKLGRQAIVGQQFALYARSVVYEEALLQFALRDALTQETALRKRLSPLIFAYLRAKYVQKKSEVSTAEAHHFFNKNKGLVLGEHVRARHIFLRRLVQCRAFKKRIRSEDAFIEHAKKYSLDPFTAKAGGDLGLLQPIQGVLGFEKQLFAMRLGEMRVFTSSKGCHLVRVVEYIPPSKKKFKEMEGTIKVHMQAQKTAKLLQQLVKRALKETHTRWYFTPPRQDAHRSLWTGKKRVDRKR